MLHATSSTFHDGEDHGEDSGEDPTPT